VEAIDSLLKAKTAELISEMPSHVNSEVLETTRFRPLAKTIYDIRFDEYRRKRGNMPDMESTRKWIEDRQAQGLPERWHHNLVTETTQNDKDAPPLLLMFQTTHMSELMM